MQNRFVERALKILVLLVALSSLSAEAKEAEKTFFDTSSSGFVVKWSDKNLSATSGDGKQVLFSARQLAQKERPPKKSKTTVDRNFMLLSLVGPIFSYQDEQTLDWPGMAHPGVGDLRLYRAIDLRHPQKATSLTDYFAADDLYAALMNNNVVKLALKETKSHPKTLPELIKAVQNSMVFVTDKDAGEQKLLFSPDLLSKFCFDNLAKDKVDVHISLYDQEGNQITPIDLTLPVKNAEVLKWLQAAESKEEGILAKKLQSLAKDAETDFHFDF